MRPQTRKPYVNLKVTQRLRSVYALRAILQTDPNYNKLKHKKSRCMKNSSTLLYSSTGMGCMTDPPPPESWPPHVLLCWIWSHSIKQYKNLYIMGHSQPL